MKKQKKNDSGITLVALVVSIIVMLVLAGVSLNATVGENGIVTRAQEAALKQKVAEELENLNLELTKMNIDTIADDETKAIQEIANYLLDKGVIDSVVTTSAGQIAAGIDNATGNKYFFGTKGDNTYRITRGTDGLLSAEITSYTSGGDITGGYALITADSFNNDDSLPEEEKGKFTITSDAEVVFMDTITGELCIYVASGVHATVGIYADITLTNKNLPRSAIDIQEGGTLDLYVADGVKVTVDSGLAQAGTTGTMGTFIRSEGGAGGYAGIHVPWTDTNNNKQIDSGDSYATLNLYGSGTIYAYGGRASNGGSGVSKSSSLSTEGNGGGGGGGAGAGIGGNGGNGGAGNSTINGNADWKDYRVAYTDSGLDGEPGENCGIVTFNNNIKVFAYGGGGGASPKSLNFGTSTGGGGYPAAGIGGGGAGAGGGDWGTGAGGFTSSSGDDCTMGYEANNGLKARLVDASVCRDDEGKTADITIGGHGGVGASYYENGCAPYKNTRESNALVSAVGGQGGLDFGWFVGGCGGVAGMGGEIRASSTAIVNAYNGNRITDTTYDYTQGSLNTEYDSGGVLTNKYGNFIPAKIYAQTGISRAVYCVTAKWGEKPQHNYSYFSTLFNNVLLSNGTRTNICAITGDFSNPTAHDANYKNVCVKEEKSIPIISSTAYRNSETNNSYGIGSGAGYIELSNGTYSVDANLD